MRARLNLAGWLDMEAEHGPPMRVRASFGRAGVATTKREGDGATPSGWLALRRLLYRDDRLTMPVCAVPCSALRPTDGWCDDPREPGYNTQVTRPFPASHETLWRDDPLYDVIGVLAWNDDPVIAGAGSAIFLHVATPQYDPTAGCIALALPDLLAVLAAGLAGIQVPAPARSVPSSESSERG